MMTRHFFDLAFTPTVKAEQTRRGSRRAYAAADEDGHDPSLTDALSNQEIEFLGERDSFYLASVSETGWPYVQHRGGPRGFVRVLDEHTLGWAEFIGNRQYVSAGNTAFDNRVSLFFMDYPNKLRLKLMGRIHTFTAIEKPDLAERLPVKGYRARLERYILVDVEAFDWNCPQHITQRFTLDEFQRLVEPLHARIAELENKLATALRTEP
jgi:predicted pyridoxine 5'-phosphate oxidase superfamily flavin-nucleotide-binding protein